MNIKSLLLVLPFLFVVKSNAQLTNAGIFKVTSGALVSTATGVGFGNSGASAIISNNGDILVRGSFTPGTDATKFVNEYVNNTDYGQLIVDSAVTIAPTEKITHEYDLKSFATENYTQLSFPFQNYYAQNFLNDLGIGALSSYDFFFAADYSSAAMYYWHNGLISPEPVARNPYAHVPTTLLGDGKRVVLNGSQSGGRTVFSTSRPPAGIKSLTGTPNNQLIDTEVINGIGFADYNAKFPTPGSAWINTANHRGLIYNNIIGDTRLPSDPDYKRHSYCFGNPYPSNIDLSHIAINGGSNDTDGTDLDMNRIIKIQPTASIVGSGDILSLYTAQFDLAGLYVSGDPQALLIQPSEIFLLILNSNTNLSNFRFRNGMKTFASLPKATNENGDPLLGPDRDGLPLNGTSVGRKIIRNASFPTLSSLSFGLQILDDENETEGSSFTYILANQSVLSNTEVSSYDNIVPSTSDVLYTLKNSDSRLKIQGIRMDESKTIPLGFKAPINGDGEYVIKTNANRMIRFGGDASAYPALFSFFDAAKDVVIPIDENFEYKFKQNSNIENRFFILYNKSQTTTPTIDVSNQTTFVAKDDNNIDAYLMIGSDVKLDNPTIKVYSSAGQLLDNFNTNGEIKVKLKNYAPGVYLIQVEGLEYSIKMISSN